jgi:hypothetical protein
MDVPILYNYKPFPKYKFGLFNIHTDVYKLPGGWVQKQEEYLIIGEDDTAYITKLQESTQGEWIGDKIVESTFILPLGIHKSRLIKWIPILELNI